MGTGNSNPPNYIIIRMIHRGYSRLAIFLIFKTRRSVENPLYRTFTYLVNLSECAMLTHSSEQKQECVTMQVFQFRYYRPILRRYMKHAVLPFPALRIPTKWRKMSFVTAKRCLVLIWSTLRVVLELFTYSRRSHQLISYRDGIDTYNREEYYPQTRTGVLSCKDSIVTQ